MSGHRPGRLRTPEQLVLPLWSPATEASEHEREDIRTIKAGQALWSIAGPAWREVVPSLSKRVQNHVAVGDCPLGLLMEGLTARLLERQR
jgi:hypothetical protein